MKELGNKRIERNKRQGKLATVIDALLVIISAPIVIVAAIIIAKTLIYPDKIPDVFSYKPFIILNEGLENGINYGDLAITRIVNTEEIKVGDIIAYRYGERQITFHKIKNINKTGEKIIFTVNSNISTNTENVTEDNIEGIYLKSLANVRNMVNNSK